MSKHQALPRLLFFVIFLATSITFGMDDPEIGLEPGKKLPAFKLSNLDGKEIALQDFQGKIVIIHLWKCQ
jgi:peroxiredoxin